jgi:Phosphotransferase enzyme family
VNTHSLPSDPRLPQLAYALDPDAMAGEFGALLCGLQVLACTVERVKYRAQGSCSISYHLRLRERQLGRVLDQGLSARLCRGGDAGRRFAKVAQSKLQASAAGPALSHLPELDMLVHWLPNDAKLPALALLCDDAELQRRCLPAVVAELTQGRGLLIEHRTTLMQHVPELRVCARVDLRVRDAAGRIVAHTVYAKADLERSGATTQQMLRTLWASPAQRRGELRTPQALLWQEEAGLHWQCAAPGRALAELEEPTGPGLSARVAVALAALHATPLPDLPRLDIAGLGPRLQQAGDALYRVEPAWHAAITQALAALASGGEALAAEPLVTLHADLHPRNILVDADRLSFIDLDSLLCGPAVFELGGWIADLLYRGVLAGAAPQQLEPACSSFLAAYEHAAGVRVNRALLAWCTAFELVGKRARRCVANLKPGRFEAVPALLSMATTLACAADLDAVLAQPRVGA